MFYAINELLLASRLIPKRPDAYANLRPAEWKNKGSALARHLKGKLILIYTNEAQRHLGYIWKIRLNETAKVHAFNNMLPEMNHNELTAFDAPAHGSKTKTAVVMLEDAANPGSRLQKKFTTTKKLIEQRGVSVFSVPLTGTKILGKTWRNLILADWTSYMLGKQNGVTEKEFNTTNPLIVAELKAALAK